MPDNRTVATFAPGFIIDARYQVVRTIGQGGAGIVYLVKDSRLENEQRAIKMVRPELLSDPQNKKQLRKEAITAQKLGHPNIVSTYNYDEWQGLAYIVMEYVEGLTLAERIDEKGRFTPEDFMPLAEQISQGLDFAHSRGVVHQDIKPSNIFVEKDGTAKLADFGIAAIARKAANKSNGTLAGTLEYMSPEVLRGEPPTPESDLYSLGILFYEMLHGRPPFTRGDIYRQHQEVEPKKIAGIPASLNHVLLMSLAKESSQRGFSPKKFYFDLEEAFTKPETQKKPTTPKKKKAVAKPKGTTSAASRAATGPVSKTTYRPKPKQEPAISSSTQTSAPAYREIPRPKRKSPEDVLVKGIWGGIRLFIIIYGLCYLGAMFFPVEDPGEISALQMTILFHLGPLLLSAAPIHGIAFMIVAYILYARTGRKLREGYYGPRNEPAAVLAIVYTLLSIIFGVYLVFFDPERPVENPGSEELLGALVVLIIIFFQVFLAAKPSKNEA
jgi:serine/threonine protein kinase